MKSVAKIRIFAFALYFVLSALLLVKGWDLRHHLIGEGGDIEAFVWMLNWWPWAIRGAVN